MIIAVRTGGGGAIVSFLYVSVIPKAAQNFLPPTPNPKTVPTTLMIILIV